MSFADKLTAARTIARANPDDVAHFADAPVGNIVDAIGRTGAMDLAIKPTTQAQTFSGSALTVNAGPRDNLAPWAALRLAQPGDVMVIATGGVSVPSFTRMRSIAPASAEPPPRPAATGSSLCRLT